MADDSKLQNLTTRRGTSRSSVSTQNAEATKTDNSTSHTDIERDDLVESDAKGNKTITQKGDSKETTDTDEIGEKTNKSTQTQTGTSERNSTQTRNLTTNGTESSSETEKADIGAAVSFVIKISGGLGTVPKGSNPPKEICK